MITVPDGIKCYLVCSPVSMRKGIDGLAAEVAPVLKMAPFAGHLFLFRGKRGDYLKLLFWDGIGQCLSPGYVTIAGFFAPGPVLLWSRDAALRH